MRTGRVVVITGAVGGMGSVIADRFLANADIVIATDTRADVLARTSLSSFRPWHCITIGSLSALVLLLSHSRLSRRRRDGRASALTTRKFMSVGSQRRRAHPRLKV
jgi:NAD(P)-dependent dehydrogenase (short-subunit alcohol dehydrogenase family)